MKKIVNNLHHIFGIITVFLVFFIPIAYYKTITKTGIESLDDFIQNWNNPLLIEIAIFSFLPWLLVIHLAWTYLFKKKKGKRIL